MKRLFPILLFLMLGHAAQSQDYACILPTQKQYYIDSNNYLRGMRINSVRTSVDTTFYYPFHTPRGHFQGSNLDTNGASWMGAEIIQLKDGRFWFFNHWGDTVAIQTQARLNDKWIMHHDTNDIYYEAQITAIDTATILGVVDSIKTITITAYDKNGVNTSAQANGIRWILSKQHGFYKVTDVYFFPYHYPGDFAKALHQYDDYYTYKIGGFHEFSLVDFKNPKEVDVYDYSVGDIFYTLDEPVFSHHWEIKKHYDSVMLVNNIGNSKEYTFQRIYSYPYYSNGNIYYKLDTGIVTLKADTSSIIKEFPEEFGNNYIYHYYPNNTSYCQNTGLYQIQTNQLVSGGTQVNIWLDVRVTTWQYKVGIGLVHHDTWKALAYRYDAFNRNLKFYRIARKNCGEYIFPVNVSSNIKSTTINIYPNPVQGNTVYIDVSNNNETYHLTVYDAIGKQVLTKNISQAASVDVSQLSTGVYLFELVNDQERIIKRVTIN